MRSIGMLIPILLATACLAQPVPEVQATIYLTTRCVPCARYIAAVKREMPPLGWILRNAGDRDADEAHILVSKKAAPADAIEAYPTTIIRKNGREVARFVGEVTPEKLSEAYNQAARE